eukprot:505907-Pyramimonas_sp.AAC.1
MLELALRLGQGQDEASAVPVVPRKSRVVARRAAQGFPQSLHVRQKASLWRAGPVELHHPDLGRQGIPLDVGEGGC